MCVVATYVIMHVIVYFGVCKCHGCSSHLCKWMFNLVMQSCPYKCVICCCSVCNPTAQDTRLIRSNHLCYSRSSHTFLITDLFFAYHTHLVILNRLCSLVSTQTVHPSEPHAVYRTHLWSGWPFLLCCLITNSSSEWIVYCTSHTPSSGCPFLLFLLIANS